MVKKNEEWWRGAYMYQVYPRSFCDTNDDGVGDLQGITKKMDYIASLGVECVWISPFFTSPMKDYGYDLSDFCDVDPMFGNLNDFSALIDAAHARGVKILIDLVMPHTSDRHPWFLESMDKTSDKADWYVWVDRKEDGSPPNNWISHFGGPAWTWSAEREQYYFHTFLKEQPKLNFHCKDVQDAMLDVAKFWLEFGVDGFRLDSLNHIFHDAALRNNPPRDASQGYACQFEGEDPWNHQDHVYNISRPETIGFIKRFRDLMDQYEDRFTIGEVSDGSRYYELAAEYTANNMIDTCYNPYFMSGAQKELTTDLIRNPIEEDLAHRKEGWPSWAFSNHDVVRSASRWYAGGQGFGHDNALSKMLIALLGSLRGTMFLYQGEELGLPESKLKFEDLRDPWGIHLWPAWQGRDGCRTPMPWDDKPTKTPSWLPISQKHKNMSFAAQHKDAQSVLNFTRDFVKWRKSMPTLRYGDIKFIDMGHKALLAFEREYEGERLICVFNLQHKKLTLPKGWRPEKVEWLYGNFKEKGYLNKYHYKIGRIIED